MQRPSATFNMYPLSQKHPGLHPSKRHGGPDGPLKGEKVLKSFLSNRPRILPACFIAELVWTTWIISRITLTLWRCLALANGHDSKCWNKQNDNRSHFAGFQLTTENESRRPILSSSNIVRESSEQISNRHFSIQQTVLCQLCEVFFQCASSNHLQLEFRSTQILIKSFNLPARIGVTKRVCPTWVMNKKKQRW